MAMTHLLPDGQAIKKTPDRPQARSGVISNQCSSGREFLPAPADSIASLTLNYWQSFPGCQVEELFSGEFYSLENPYNITYYLHIQAMKSAITAPYFRG
jgi:hypothetical protein